MIPREDFIFTIGYDGPVAIVDGQAKRTFGNLSTKALAEVGLFRAAYSSALHSGSPEELDAVVAAYNKASGSTLTRESPLSRLFGVLPLEVAKFKVL
ncbi:MAG: hypothetical protein WCT14_10215 [Treponemataceae bacterium]